MAASLVFGPNPSADAVSISKVIIQAGAFVEEEQSTMDKRAKGSCWKGYKRVGMKRKGKRLVPNCVPKGKG
jgi:hypothetical protein